MLLPGSHTQLTVMNFVLLWHSEYITHQFISHPLQLHGERRGRGGGGGGEAMKQKEEEKNEAEEQKPEWEEHIEETN